MTFSVKDENIIQTTIREIGEVKLSIASHNNNLFLVQLCKQTELPCCEQTNFRRLLIDFNH